jgi:hypothetical protein
MKNKSVKKGILRSLVLLMAIGVYSMAHAQRVNHPVELRLDPSAGILEATTRGKCQTNNHPGCIEVDTGTQARINFSFVGNRNCDLEDNSSWQAGEVYLGGKGSGDKPESWGGFEDDAEVQADFNLADASTGRLVKEAGSNQNSIVILNDNTSVNGYDIWYTVTAVCVDESGNVLDEIRMDPRIKNGGTQ